MKQMIQQLAGQLGYRIVNRQTHAALLAQLDDARAAARAAEVGRDELHSQVNALQAERDALQSQVNLLQAERSSLRVRVESLQEAFDAARREAAGHGRARQSGNRVQQDAAPTAPSGDGALSAEWDCAGLVKRGLTLEEQGDLAAATTCYTRAASVIHGYGPATAELRRIGEGYFQQAEALRRAGNSSAARPLYVAAIEFYPRHAAARQQLQAIIEAENRRDLTRICYVCLDPVRGEAMYRETFLRSFEYLASGGILGEVLEFGVLAGFTGRISCEIMRDLGIYKQLHLFDSFDGLPEYTSPIDANSYDIGERNLWENRMRFEDSFVSELGEPIDRHVFSRLCDVVRPERLFVYRGFYSETLRRDLPIKAALLHIDCDLYQSTVEVFTRLYEMDALQDGSVILFDDWNCFKASPNYGERRAFQEFLDGQDRFSASPFFTYGFNGAAFFLHDKTA